jgi:FkbM family methyltransferase
MISEGSTRARAQRSRIAQFLRKPWKEKTASLCYHWVQRFPAIPIPVHLPFGGWWLARNDFVGAALFNGGFENTERSFVERFLRPGMAVLDIGAHHGFYTLLASRKVGSQGRVLAVEASPREREKLELHLRINGCKNVQVESRALADREGDAEFYVVKGSQTGCNSLRRPEVSEAAEAIPVRLARLDNVLREHQIEKVDFIKLDVEGAELSVLRGAAQLLKKCPRPVILAEVFNIRTRPWGYEANESIRYLAGSDYRWFRPISGGGVEEVDARQDEYEGNFVAIPEERIVSLSI